MTRKSRSKRRLIARLIIFVLLLLAAIIYVTSIYKWSHFGSSQIDEIIFYFQNGLADGQSSSIAETVQDNILFCAIVFFILLLPVIDFYRDRIRINLDLSLLGRKKNVVLNPSQIRIRYKLIYAIIMFLISIAVLMASFGVFGYLRSLSHSSQIYEKHYVDPKNAKLIFPEQKRNLIYIYLESMENTLMSTKNGGQVETSLTPELENLATNPDNVSFSNSNEGLGGALPAHGTTWTVGGMTAQGGGVPLKANILGQDHNSYGRFKKFLPGSYMLGDILQKEGYNQTFIMGSVAGFGGRDKLLSQHGGYNIQDYEYAKKHQLIPKDYGVWWGYEDKKLFDFAKLELNRLAEQDKPFNLQLLTVDTHFTDGWLDPSCDKTYAQQYDNVHACSSKMVGQFIDWVKQQPFAENTTIVLSGDHLGMQTSYYDAKITQPDYQRTTYNVFINPAISPIKSKERSFTALDMYPSTLAAMGVIIPGNKLAMGVNLFSDAPTLVEQYGSLNALNDEINKRSEFYEKKILLNSKN